MAKSTSIYRILIVDDNRAIHEDFRKILSRDETKDAFQNEEDSFFGTSSTVENQPVFELEFAVQGNEALELVTAAKETGNPYALVFMDVRMPPGWDGVETTSRLWKVDPDVQVVICTAFSDFSWEQMMDMLGHTDRLLILKKPFDTIEVVQIAHSLTAKWSLLHAARGNEEYLISAVSARTRELEIEVAERRRSEDALKFTQFSVDHASDAMFWIAPNSQLVYVNASTCEALGYSPEELKQMSLLHIVPTIQAIGWEAFWSVLEQDKRRTLEAVCQTREGRQFPVELTVSFFDFGGQKSLCASARDITARNETLHQLAAARDVATESARLKGQFLANMSHEIRTPMNGVIGMSDLLSHTNLDREQREYVNTVRKSADLLLGIINDILDSSKIESGTMTFQSQEFDLRDIVEHVLDVVAPAARTKHLELAGCLQPLVHPYVVGDHGRIKQVLTNLVGNAVKFTEKGEVTLLVSNEESSAREGTLRFEVKDTGLGIDEASIEKIFEPFHQADGSDARKYGGTGLGLSICKQIIEAMGGQMGVTSDLGKGSTFWFSLALQKHANSSSQATSRVIPDLPVLIVDDNAINLQILQLQLTNLQLRSTAVANGRDALSKLRSSALEGSPFSLAILDMQMPGMDGLSLAKAIKADPEISSTRLIILSSLGDQVLADELTDAGVEEYVMKPVKQSRLESSIITMLEGGKSTVVVDEAPPKSAKSITGAKILVAEDNLINQQVVLLQLKSLGHIADLAADGFEVLAALQRSSYDLILMDCQMPGMDGYDTTRRIREIYDKPICIVALTANAMIGDREKCIDCGMDDHLSKPFRLEDLNQMLVKWLQNHITEPETKPVAVAVPAEVAALDSSDFNGFANTEFTPVASPVMLDTPESVMAPPEDQPPVDVSRLLAITGGDPYMFQKISMDYLAQAEEILACIVLALERRDAEEVHSLAHKLGGSSSTCGMTAIVEPLARLERMGKTGQLVNALDIHQMAFKQLFEIRSFLMKHVKSQEYATI